MSGISFRLLLAVQLAILAFTGPAAAHELRPAYLEIREAATDKFAVLWKVPALGDRRLGLYAKFPKVCEIDGEPVRSIVEAAYFERWNMTCRGGLKGRQITIAGLSATLTDVLVRLSFADGTTEVQRLTPESPILTVAGQQSMLEISRTYLMLGVDHILTGLDHLLFIAALMLLIGDWWTLLKTITAFTVAHSLTLVGSVLGYISLPQRPVEAVIALSIAFVASEVIKMRAGELRLSESHPWLVAFAFGLLHGFGFAGALEEIGLPQVDVPLALLMFNVGVESGQILFIGGLLLAFNALKGIFTLPIGPTRSGAAYAIGVISTFWLLSRVAAF